MNYSKELSTTAERQFAHSSHVSQLTKILARRAGYSQENIKLLMDAAALHDIGKQQLPLSVLNKNGYLTESEFMLIKTHAYIGSVALLKKARLMVLAAIIAEQHHEKLDGSGYAEIKNIHESAKLVAVADIFDALISERAYKKAWSPYKIMEYMEEKKRQRAGC